MIRDVATLSANRVILEASFYEGVEQYLKICSSCVDLVFNRQPKGLRVAVNQPFRVGVLVFRRLSLEMLKDVQKILLPDKELLARLFEVIQPVLMCGALLVTVITRY